MYKIQLEPEVELILARDTKNPDRTLIFFHDLIHDDLEYVSYINTSRIKIFLAETFKKWNIRHPVPETIEV